MDEIKQAIKEALQELYPKEYMTVEEFAKYQGISRAYAFQLIERKSFPACILRIGKRTFIVKKLYDEHAEKLAKMHAAM